jgi:hypothetical protein
MRRASTAGGDGKKVPISRLLLSPPPSSNLFEIMLFANFYTSTSSVILIDYSSKTSQIMVHYCFSDEGVMEPLEDCCIEDMCGPLF